MFRHLCDKGRTDLMDTSDRVLIHERHHGICIYGNSTYTLNRMAEPSCLLPNLFDLLVLGVPFQVERLYRLSEGQ